MSDNDDDFMCEDDEDYGLVTPHLIYAANWLQSVQILQEYSEDSNSEPDVDLENQYYNSKALKEDEPVAALQSFQKVLDLENGEKGEWGFKALKQMIKINFRLVRGWKVPPAWDVSSGIFHLQTNYEEMMVRYKQLLTYIKSAVTRNHSEKSINSILDYISTSKNVSKVEGLCGE